LRVKKCVRKQGGDVESTVYIEGTFEHAIWQGGSNNLIHLSIGPRRMAQMRVGPARTGDPSPALQFIIGDHRGSGVLSLDASGGWINREEFTPYGETSFGGYSRKRYRFAGKERDEESGLDYFGMRYYASWHGRWMTPDPGGLRDGLNLYAFVGGNPLNHVDPSGTEEHADDALDAGVPTQQEKAEGVDRMSEEAKQETGGTSLPGGAADQASASKGIQAVETNRHANAFAKKETIKGAKVGTAAFFSQTPLQMYDNLLFMGLLSAGLDVTLGKPSGLGVKMEGADTELSQNVAGATFGAWCTLATIGTGVVAELGMENAVMRFNAAQLKLKAPSLIAGEGASGTTSDGRVTVYRFHDVTNPETLKPNLSREPLHVQAEEAQRAADPNWNATRGEWHARGITESSPYVSVLTDPAAGANSYDPWLKAIVTGAPMPARMGGRIVVRAPHLSVFRVPKDRLYFPKYELSLRETEALFLGSDLHMFQVDALPNPYTLPKQVTHTPLPILWLPRDWDNR
jgi:RHS repeat-associated protein